MSEINIFLKDVEVPEVVHKKADSAFLSIQTEGKRTMKKGYYKFMAAAAVCAALVAAVWVTNGIGERFDSDLQVKEDSVGREDSYNSVNSVLSELDRMFTLKVQAAELEVGKPVPLIASGNSQTYGFGATDYDVLHYCISVPLTCEGEGIESVTYSINNGAFQIVQPENDNEKIIVGGQLYGEEINSGWIGGYYEGDDDYSPSRIFEKVLYKSFTLDYERQSDEYTWINICNSRPFDEKIYNLIWGGEKTTATDESNGFNRLLDHTVITCTAHYADGTEQSADIQVGSQVMMEDFGDDGMVEMSVITFELQN